MPSKEYDQEAARRVQATYAKNTKLTEQTLTIGCEFEFVLAHYHPPAVTKSDFDIGQYGTKMIRDMISKPLSTTCADPNCAKIYDRSYAVSHVEFDQYNAWNVAYDETARPNPSLYNCMGDEAENYEFYPMELKSRILRYDDPGQGRKCDGKNHILNFKEEIKALLTCINNLNRSPGQANNKSEHHVLLTRDCGFHVHIGNGAATPVPFSTVKKVFSTFVACERQLDRLHAVDRISGTFVLNDPTDQTKPLRADTDCTRLTIDPHVKNDPLSHFFMSAAYVRSLVDNQPAEGLDFDPDNGAFWPLNNWKGRLGQDIQSWLTLVSQAKTILELREMQLCHDKACNLNVNNLPNTTAESLEAGEKRLTIEFRQHAATLAPPVALSWIDVVAKLVLFCHNVSDAAFADLMKPGSRFRVAEFRAVELLKGIQCTPSTVFYYQSKTDPRSDITKHQLDNEKTIADNLQKRKDPIGVLAAQQVRWQYNNESPAAVEDRIQEKLYTGCYGLFRKADLPILLPKHKLEKLQRVMLEYQTQS